MKKRLLFIICIGGYFNVLNAQFLTTTVGNGVYSESAIYPETGGGISGYVRGSAYGGGQDGGINGSKGYDLATSFAEAAVIANYNTSYSEGYTFFRGEVRFRQGQYFNGTLNNTAGTNDVYKTDIELRDLYVGYRNNKFEITFGNQNIQWGRGIGSNPTNNISPSNIFFLSSNPQDTKMYNLMLAVDYQIRPNLDLQVIGIPLSKVDPFSLGLFNLGGAALTVNPQVVPDLNFKNGGVGARLNLNVGPLGGSLSYFNGYDPFPSITMGFATPFTGALTGNAISYRKQTFGGDFGIPIFGKPRGTGPTNDLMIMGEFAYNRIANPTDLAYIPQSNIAMSIGLIKTISATNDLDKTMIIVSWNGKQTPNYTDLVLPTMDPTNPMGYYQDLIKYQLKGIVRMFNGQQKPLDHGLLAMVSQTFARGKVNTSLTCKYGLLDLPGTSSGHNIMFSPRASWNITKSLNASAGAMRMWGPSANIYGPIMGGYFSELKVSF